MRGGSDLEKPILFNTAMVQAILEGKKTSTRRIFKKPFEVHPNGMITKQRGNERLVPYEPPYHIGDTIYVRETWLKADDGLHYKADETFISKEHREAFGYKWKPSIHMHKEAARLFIEVTDVRAERLNDMNEADAFNEGMSAILGENLNVDLLNKSKPAKAIFKCLWDSIYSKQGNGWEENPWVWVIEFKKINRSEVGIVNG